MTKAEAIAALNEGKKVRHPMFQEHEWLRKLHRGDFQTEDGYIMSQRTFEQNYASITVWGDGWEIFEGNN